MRLNPPFVQKALGGLVLLLVVVAPTQWSLPLPGGVHLTLADLLLVVAAPLGLCAGLRAWPLPFSHALFLGLAGLSVALASDRREAVKEWIQLALYFGLATGLAETALRQGGRRGMTRAVQAFLVAGVFIVALAVAQYWRVPHDNPLEVRGTFGNRNVLGGYLALLLPLAFGLHLYAASLWRRLALALLVLAGLSVCLSGPALLAIVLVLVALAAQRGRFWLLGTGLVLMAGYTLVLPRMPRANDYAAFASMALYDEAGEPSRRYPEWQAAAVMALERPWTGQGLGSYQKRIGSFYGVVPNATGPAEPDIQNLYLVLAATAGLPACLAFLAMLLDAAASACRGRLLRGTDEGGLLPGLEAGLAGALAAFALTAVWHPLLVRGIGLPLALILVAARFRKVADEL